MEGELVVSEFDVRQLEHRKVAKEGFGTRHVYSGMCDGVLTKWVTVSKWDGRLRFANGNYADTQGKEILVFEDDEDEWYEW